jgi:hypothetical protein
MSDNVTHEHVEQVLEKAPLDLIKKLPDDPKRKVIETHLAQAGRLAHEMVESAEAGGKVKAAMSVEQAQREGIAFLTLDRFIGC